MATAGELVVEEVAENLEEAAAVVRTLDTKAVGFLLGGLAVGVGIGFFIGYRYNREKLRMEAFEASEEELQRIREYYGRTEKPELENIVAERGYATSEEPSRPLPAPVPVREPEAFEPPTEPVTIPEGDVEVKEKDKDAGWSMPLELAQRTPHVPYIIHQDEYMENDTEFPQVTLTYYENDEVLADVDDTVINNAEQIVGVSTLSRFGHGSDDYNVVYVRNPHLEMEYEICRVQKSFEVEVQGLDDAPEEPETD